MIIITLYLHLTHKVTKSLLTSLGPQALLLLSLFLLLLLLLLFYYYYNYSHHPELSLFSVYYNAAAGSLLET